MKSLYTYLVLGIMAFLSVEVNAQNQLMGITLIQSQVEVKGKNLYVNFDVDMSQLDFRSNQGVVLIPSIQSKAAGKIKILPEVIVNGRNRQISYDRTIDRKRKQALYNEPYIIVKNNKKSQTIISYKMVIPFEEWMENSTLSLTEGLYGCRNTLQETSNLIVAQNIESPVEISPLLTYLSPVLESPIKEQESITSVILFPESKSTILLDYEHNKQNIAQIESILSGVTVKYIHIIGSASPEGAYLFNEQLSKERALSLVAYLKTHYNISTSLDKVEWVGENWDSLLQLVVQSEMKYKQEAIDIIENTDVFSGRENQLMKLNSGKTYQYMQEYFFPELRYASYTIYFEPIPFDITKGRELMTSNPQSLSVTELLLVADSYSNNSIEYKNAIEITVKTYPDNMIANINASSVALSAGNIAGAKQYLARFEQQPEALNNLGVISMIEGNYESAHQYFQKAIDLGSVEAGRNMEELTKITKTL